METFDQVISKYKYVRLVEDKDNKELATFLESIPMECGPINLSYSRRPNVIDSFNEQSKENYIFIYENEDNSIGGFGSLIINELYINGEKCKAGYYADMRLSPKISRKTHVQSRQIYAETLARYKEINELKDIKYFYTAILKNNTKALNALTKKKRGINYHELCEYDVLTLLKIKPQKTKKNFTVELKQNNQNAPKHRLFQMVNNNYDQIIIKEDEKILFSATLKKMKGRHILVTKAPKLLQLLCRLLPLIKRPQIQLNKEFVQRYITDIVFYDQSQKEDILKTFFNYIYQSQEYKETHAYSFINQRNACLKKYLKGCIFEETTGILFQVTCDDETQSIFPEQDTEIGFDICLS